MINKLDLYRIFCVVGKNESFSNAAKELYMTQPAVSQAIMQLEKELDTRLFNRTPRGVTLTSEGKILFEYIQSALNLIEAGEEKLLEYKSLTVGELKIGVGDTISRYFLLPYLEKFHHKYPGVKLKIVNGTTFEIVSLLKSGKVDLSIVNLPIDDVQIEIIPCYEIQDIFVYGEKFKRLFERPVELQYLLKLPLIFLEPKANSRIYVEKYLTSKGITVVPEFELGSHELLLEFARINLGIACVTKQFSKEYLEKGLVYEVPLIEPIPKRSIGIGYLKTVPLSSAAEKFVEIIDNSFV